MAGKLFLLMTFVIVFEIIYFYVESAPPMGPYEFRLKSMEKCKTDGNYTKYYYLYTKNVNSSKLFIYFNMSYPFPLDRAIDMEINIAIKRSGVWNNNFFTQKFSYACEAFYNHVLALIDNFHFNGKPYQCPIAKGKHESDALLIKKKSQIPGIKYFIYGSLRVDLKYIKGTEIIQCIRTYADSIPK